MTRMAKPRSRVPNFPVAVPALKLNQNGSTVFVTAFSGRVLKFLKDRRVLLVEQFQGDRDNGADGYQRIIDEDRANEIARFVVGDLPFSDIIRPVLPQSVLLNSRPDHDPLQFEETGSLGGTSTGVLRIYERVRLAEVDGQHRMEGLLRAVADGQELNFEIPVSILSSFSLAQEAAQFLTINSTQKKVDPSLQLRVIHRRSREEASKLARALRLENWRLAALVIAITLNDSSPSPWESQIRRPNEPRSRSKLMTEQSFVTGLKPVCVPTAGNLALIPPARTAEYLRDFWAVISEHYPEASHSDHGRAFVLKKTVGVYPLHELAPLVYDLCRTLHGRVDRDAIRGVMAPLFRKYKQSHWAAKTGALARRGSSAKAARLLANDFARLLVPEMGPHIATYNRLRKRFDSGTTAQALDSALSLLNPLRLREFNTQMIDNVAQGTAPGVYVLCQLTRTGRATKLYVGKSDQSLTRRLKTHYKQRRGEWTLFAAETTTSPLRVAALEGALKHLTAQSRIRTNKISTPDCPYC